MAMKPTYTLESVLHKGQNMSLAVTKREDGSYRTQMIFDHGKPPSKKAGTQTLNRRTGQLTTKATDTVAAIGDNGSITIEVWHPLLKKRLRIMGFVGIVPDGREDDPTVEVGDGL